MSKRGKKKQNKDDDDQMWQQKDKQAEKKLQNLKKGVQIKEESDEETQHKQFIFNFSNQKQFLKKEKEIQQKEQERQKLLRTIRQQQQRIKKQQKPQLSDAALAEKSQRKQKQKQKKQIKDKLKQQRKEAQKIQQTIEKQKKQQQQKLQELAEAQYIKRRESQSRDGWKIVIGLLLFILVAGYLQYKSEINQRYDSFRVKDSQDLYSILEADSGLSDNQLKQKYKKLAVKYHPDKNKDCVDCKERFARILKAWQILGNPEKREAYDSNNGVITKIKSKSITLTHQNYYEEVQSSNDLWIIQAYDSTSQYCHHFSQFWEQIVDSYRGLVKFGRIDIWSQNDMRDYIPYSFTIFPSIYSIRKDKSSDIYGLDPRKPIETMKQFIEKELSKQYPEVKIDLSTLNQKLSTISKPLVVTNKLMNQQLKSILSKYSDYVDGYMVEDKQYKLESNQIRVYYTSTDYNKYILKTLSNHFEFSLELPKYFVQKMSLCQMINYCQDYPCAIVSNRTSQTFTKTKYPQILIDDNALTQKVNQIKSKLGLFQNFQYTIYFNGKVQFGNLQDLDVINVQQQGQIIQLTCIPSIRIPYWKLIKIGGILLLMLYTSNRKILGVLGLIAAYMVYNIFF